MTAPGHSDAHKRWTIEVGEPEPDGVGMAVVDIQLTNGRGGRLPPLKLHVNWKPGMEAADVKAFALGILSDAALGLSKDAVAVAAVHMAMGQ